MPHVLRTNDLEISIDEPNEGYQGTRFDWSGKLTSILFQGMPLTTFEKQDSRTAGDFGKACYNEFGIDTPLGFEEAEIGGWFHKIGIGLLRKQKDSYFFSDDFELRPCGFKVKKAKEGMVINCSAPVCNGYAYELTKEIKLFEKGFEIHYHLLNTGDKAIQTDEYCHNFLAFAHGPIDESYVLQFAERLDPRGFNELVNPNGVTIFKGKELHFKTTPTSEIFFSNITQGKHTGAEWHLYHRSYQIILQEKGNFQTDKINVWGSGHVISPELFFKIDIAPGQNRRWKRQYLLFRDKGN